METWNKLCEKVNSDRKGNLSERTFEKETIKYFLSGLGWSEWENNLIEQYQIDAAHTKLYADFALFQKGEIKYPELIIELKKPTHKPSRKQKAEDVRQIETYMKQKDCCFGLYFGEKMELYFIDSTLEKRIPKLILSVPFEKNNEDGQTLIGLLRNNNGHEFSFRQLLEFCQEQIVLNNAASYWCSEEGKSQIYEYILTYSKLSKELKDRLYSNLQIDIRKKDSACISNKQKTETSNLPIENISPFQTKETSSYIFNLRVPQRGVDATMHYFPNEKKYVIKAGSKVSKESKDSCSDNALQKRKEILSNILAAREEDSAYILLKDVEIVADTPNLSAQICTGRSTNARTEWKDENGRAFGISFPKKIVDKKEKISSPPKTEIQGKGAYSLDGITFPALRRFVLEVVKRYIKEHPSETFEQILEVFPPLSENNRTLITEQEWEMKNEDAKERYFHKKDDRLHDSFGKAFLVSNQWTSKDVAAKIIPLAIERFGWVIHTKG